MSTAKTLPQRIGFWLGPALAGVMLSAGVPPGLSFAAWGTGVLMVWMAVWWATEPIPIPVTSLLPLIVLPVIGAGTPGAVGAAYAHHIVLLLLGGFILALGIERWDLHKRIALTVISFVGASPKALIAGFMAATALLSMGISNTATTLMMVPIALSAAAALSTSNTRFTVALLLGVCYAASIGGVATPIGTPTNLIALDWLQRETGANIGFLAWMAFGVPSALLILPVAWWVVTRGLHRRMDAAEAVKAVEAERRGLGPMNTPEVRIALIFALIAVLWIGRLFWINLLDTAGFTTLTPFNNAQADMMIAVFGAVLVFIVPAGGQTKRALLTWDEAVKLPWGVLLLFGGGIALGRAVTATGLSQWIGEQLAILGQFPPVLIVAAVVALVIFLTELTSNVATMTTLAPVLGALAISIDVDAASLLAPAAVAASCAFMLPVATAPNAIIYATGEVTIEQMLARGLRINLLGIVFITAVGFWLAPLVL